MLIPLAAFSREMLVPELQDFTQGDSFFNFRELIPHITDCVPFSVV
jgi:hypothetical protein